MSANKNNSGKFLTFRLGNEEYGLEILKVIEIIGLMDITKIPRTPDYVEGVINLRGVIHPVIDIRKKFGMEKVDYTDQTCIIVIVIGNDENQKQLGIIVDKVSEVIDISEDEIDETPSLGTGIDTNFILGMAKSKGHVKILLSVEKIFSDEEMQEVASIAEQD